MPEYRITMRKHQYSASVCAKSVFQIVPKLDCIMQYFMLFPMVCSILGHKLTNVKTARINKVIIALICLKNYTAQASIFSKPLRRICLPNCSGTHLYCAVFHGRSNDGQHIGAQARSPTSKLQGLIG